MNNPMTGVVTWSSRTAFLYATVGAAVGLGNLWRFPYLAGNSGGGAFVIIYIAFVACIALPLVMSELALGRAGKKSAVAAMIVQIKEGHHPFWKSIGWLSVCIPLVSMGFYSIVTGWSLDYVIKAASGEFVNIDAANSTALFDSLTANWQRLSAWHTGFMVVLVVIVGLGVKRGLETTVKVMMPALFVILILLAIYSMSIGDTRQALHFLFDPDFSKITFSVIVQALGQALFSLAIGVGALITYGAYLSDDENIPRAAGLIAVCDTLVALLAGLAIFPIVFQFGLLPSEGEGLIFKTLPIAFGQLFGGSLFGALFFTLMTFAAFTSALSMLEPIVAVFEAKGYSRKITTWVIGLGCWCLGMSAALSFNLWKDVRPIEFITALADRNIFQTLDYMVSNILLPINAFLIAVFLGWRMSRKTLKFQFEFDETSINYKLWSFSMKYITPTATAIIIYHQFFF